MSFISDLPTWLLAAVLLALMFAANEIGFRIGESRPDEPEQSRSVSNGLKASVFALVAFLLGFAFSMTAGRHDVRRRLVLDEANAIGTLHLRAGTIDSAPSGQIRNSLQAYLGARLEYFDHTLDPLRRQESEEQMSLQLDNIWAAVERSAKTNDQATRTSQIIPAANEVIDLFSTRAWAADSHLPQSVVVLLIVSVLVSCLLAGHSSGQSDRRHVGLWTAFNVLFALVLFVVLDFDRPRRGLVRVDHSPLVELQRTLAE
jgi:hypothetical protein